MKILVVVTCCNVSFSPVSSRATQVLSSPCSCRSRREQSLECLGFALSHKPRLSWIPNGPAVIGANMNRIQYGPVVEHLQLHVSIG